MVERAGFPAVYMTGFGAAASMLGVPDLGLVTATEMTEHAGRLTAAVSVPVIADADTGFGDTLNVRRTVYLYERAHAAAIQIEDQVSPKRCGHMENKQVVDVAEMVRRVRAAVSARREPATMIVARTDACAVAGLDEALRRGESYLQAGADALFIEAPRSDAELEQVGRAFRGVPLIANMVEAGKTPYRSAAELQAFGFAIAIFPVSLLFAATHAVSRALDELRAHGKLVGETPAVDFSAFNELMGLKDYLHTARSFEPGQQD